jgi:phosphoenolpyruvate-protein kinase (PTS system EI component)
VTIRTLDLGGDKEVANLALPHEDNPQLGLRSIRLSFTHLERSVPSCARSCARAPRATCGCSCR